MSLSAAYNHNIRLPRWAADIIANPPGSGEGFQLWLFRAARALWKCGRSADEIREILENAATTCGQWVSAREISDAVREFTSQRVSICQGTLPPLAKQHVKEISP
jgi:hypothetical protein